MAIFDVSPVNWDSWMYIYAYHLYTTVSYLKEHIKTFFPKEKGMP